MEISVRRVAPDEWPLYRDIRLASLRDAPEAFGATLDDALQFDESDWRRGVQEPTWIAQRASAGVGMIRLTSSDDGRRHLSSMWVAPQVRGRHVGERLIAALEEEARGAGADEIFLRVVGDNHPAVRLYQRTGYADDGRRHVTSRGHQEIEMRKVLVEPHLLR